MRRIESKIDTKSQELKDNQASLQRLVEEFRERLEKLKQGGPERARKRHLDRKKLLPRDRVAKLFDRNTPFLEFSPFAAYDMYKNEAPCAGMITGTGWPRWSMRSSR